MLIKHALIFCCCALLLCLMCVCVHAYLPPQYPGNENYSEPYYNMLHKHDCLMDQDRCSLVVRAPEYKVQVPRTLLNESAG